MTTKSADAPCVCPPAQCEAKESGVAPDRAHNRGTYFEEATA